MTYTPTTLVETLLSQPGVEDLGWSKTEEGVTAIALRGVNNRVAIIDMSEEYFDEDEVFGHLTKLGLNDLLSSMCPTIYQELQRIAAN